MSPNYKPLPSDVYILDANNDRALIPRLNSSTVFTWRELPSNSPFGKTAHFAITFFIHTSPPFSILDFANLLLYIIGTYSLQATDLTQLFTHLGYVIRPDGVSGVLLCTSFLGKAYDRAVTTALLKPNHHAVNGWPVITLPLCPRFIHHPHYVHLSCRIAK